MPFLIFDGQKSCQKCDFATPVVRIVGTKIVHFRLLWFTFQKNIQANLAVSTILTREVNESIE